MFRGSSTQLYVPAFTQKDFHYSVHTGLPIQGTSTENLGNAKWEYTTPLFNNTTSHQRQGTTQITSTLRGMGTQPNNNQPLIRGIRLKVKQLSTSHLRDKTQSQHSNNHLFIKRDINTITSHQRDITKYERFTTWWYQQPQTNFLIKQRSYK